MIFKMRGGRCGCWIGQQNPRASGLRQARLWFWGASWQEGVWLLPQAGLGGGLEVSCWFPAGMQPGRTVELTGCLLKQEN